jgi:hypothetical protein
MEQKDYVVLVNLKGEAISLGAENQTDALNKAKLIIEEQYGKSVSVDATYKIA